MILPPAELEKDLGDKVRMVWSLQPENKLVRISLSDSDIEKCGTLLLHMKLVRLHGLKKLDSLLITIDLRKLVMGIAALLLNLRAKVVNFLHAI